MKRYRLRQGKLREDPHGEWVRASDADVIRDKLRRVRDQIKFAANSPGGVVAEIDDVLRSVLRDDEMSSETCSEVCCESQEPPPDSR